MALGLGVGLGVGFGVGLGVGRGGSAQLLTPEPETWPEDAGTWYRSTGVWPDGGNSAAASARIFARSGSWIEPRASEPGLTSGWTITARYVRCRPTRVATSAR